MSEKTLEFSHKRPTRETSREEMRGHLRVITALAPEANRERALEFAARVLDIPYARVREIFYYRAYRIEAHEADRIRAYVQQAEKLIARRARHEAEVRALVATDPKAARLSRYPLRDLEVAAERQAAKETAAPKQRARG